MAATGLAYLWVPAWRALVSAPGGAHPDLESAWYASLLISFLPPFIACFAMGWFEGGKRGACHGAAMGTFTVVAFMMIDLIEQPATYAEPVTKASAPVYLLGWSAFYILSTLAGAAGRVVWRTLSRSS